jgi:flagellar hook-associated protein 2
MGRIQSNIGLSTGTDIQKTIDQLLSISSRPRDRLESRIKAFQGQQLAINELTALVIGVQLQGTRLGTAANLSSLTATSSASDVLKVATTGTPATGNYSVQTLQTAQTSAAASNTFTSASDTVQAGELVVRTGGFVDASTPLTELRGGAGVARGKIQITDRSGTSREIDLSNAITIEDVVKQINNTSGIRVSARVSGDRLVLSDLTGANSSNLIVGEVGEGRTAADLGWSGVNVAANTATGDDLAFLDTTTRLSNLLDNRGLGFVSGNDLTVSLKDGSTLNIDLNATRNPTTIGQLLTTLNAASPSKLEARISSDGNGLEFIDKTSGSGNFSLNGNAAEQLGLSGLDGSSGTIASPRLQSTLQGPLLASLNGGRGLGTLGVMTIRNRAGVTTNVNLSSAQSLRDVIDTINQANAGVTASLNRNRTGLALQDNTGSTSVNLQITDGDAQNTATKLKLTSDVATNAFDGQALGLQYVSRATTLSQLNQGRGVRSGSFTIKDSNGQTAGINLTQLNAKTVGDVIKAINDTTIGVEARLNESGDGLVLIDTAGGSQSMTVTDLPNSNAALDLGIRGTSKTVTVESVSRKQIEGSQTFRLSLSDSDDLNDVVQKINNASGPLTASILTAGPSTVRLLLSSRASGEVGRIVAEGEGVGMSLATTAAARNAVIAVGASSDAGGTLVQSSTNDFEEVISGLKLTVAGVDSSPVQVSVTKNSSSIEKNLQLFVDQFNKVVEKLDKETLFDAENKITGQLFGSGEALRIEQTMTNLVSARTFGTGKVQSLADLGITLGENGKLSFDKTRLNRILESNTSDVEAYFTKENTGFAARAKKTMDSLVAVRTGALVVRSEALQRRVEDGSQRVEFLTGRLNAERTRLEKQFYGMEESIAKIRGNTSAISSIQNLFLLQRQ